MVTPISEIIFSGFVSKIVNNSVDASWIKIKKIVKNKKSEHQNMESQIYNVIVNAFNQATYNEYENNQDKVYQAAENLLLGYEKVKSDDIEIVRSGLNILGKKVDNEVYLEFKGIVYDEICKKENVELYHAILLWLLERKNEYDRQEIEQLNQKLDEVIQILRIKEKASNVQYGDIKREIKSRTQEYADKWNENMFLNDFDEWDENAGVNVKLKDVYLEEHLPHFTWRNNVCESTNLKKFLSQYIYEKDENKMLLILGQPGIGKSTLITWITTNFYAKFKDILVYQFASDVKYLYEFEFDDKKEELLIGDLKLSYKYLEGKVLVLDGFDEINVGNSRSEVLNCLFRKLVKKLNSTSVIITCRENYIQDMHKVECVYITLQPWEITQIQSFCNIYSAKTKHSISDGAMKNILKNKEVLGVPLILYMTLSLNISVENEDSIVDIYDQIFSLEEGGIYERCFKNTKNNKIERYDDPHWIRLMKEQIHQISRDIAMWMFENKSEEAYIPREEYHKVCDHIMQNQDQNNSNIKQDFLIGNFFKLVKHCEGIDSEKLYFVHRSIYEYFVVETIYSSIENAMMKLTEESQVELAGKIAIYLKKGMIVGTIGEYLQYKLIKFYNIFDVNKKKHFYQWWEKSAEKMIKAGMFFYTGASIYTNIISKEIRCFLNLINILRLLMKHFQKEYILKDESVEVQRYIKYCCATDEYRSGLNLSKLFLESVDLSAVNFENADLSGTYLSNTFLTNTNLLGTDLSKAVLRGAHLKGSNLMSSNLIKADLSGADLRNAYIMKANLTEANLTEANLIGANLTRVNLAEANLTETNFVDSDLTEANLTGANLTDTNLIGANLTRVNLAEANLTGTILDELQIVNMQEKYLKYTRIYIERTGDIIKYMEYSKKYKK